MPKALYFLADIHLSEQQPAITTAFCATLKALASTADAVYLLGDLFDYWLGDDLTTPFHEYIAANIAALPCQVYYQHGNRDFLLAQDYARRANMCILAERHLLILDNQRVLLEHGDLLCIDDRGYQRLRLFLRNRRLQKLYALLPRRFKQGIAAKLRAQSKQRTKKKPAHITDTNPEEIARVMNHYQADILIHGHTHRPAVKQVNGKPVFVLGDWRPHGKILRYCNKDFIITESK